MTMDRNISIDIEIKLVKSWPANEIVELYKAGGWWLEHYSQAGILPLIKGSFAFAVAIDLQSGKAIGARQRPGWAFARSIFGFMD